MFEIANSEDASGQALFSGYKVNQMRLQRTKMDIFNIWVTEAIIL